MHKNAVARESGGMPLRKVFKMRCFAIVSEDVLSLKCLSYSLVCSS